MNTFSIEELDREEIEFLPARVVMTTCQPRPSCYQPCAPKPLCEPTSCPPADKCDSLISLQIKARIGGIL